MKHNIKIDILEALKTDLLKENIVLDATQAIISQEIKQTHCRDVCEPFRYHNITSSTD